MSIYYTRQAVHVYSNIEGLPRNHSCSGKALIITYFECESLALIIQHVKRIRRVTLSPVALLSILYFFQSYPINDAIFQEVY